MEAKGANPDDLDDLKGVKRLFWVFSIFGLLKPKLPRAPQELLSLRKNPDNPQFTDSSCHDPARNSLEPRVYPYRPGRSVVDNPHIDSKQPGAPNDYRPHRYPPRHDRGRPHQLRPGTCPPPPRGQPSTPRKEPT